MSRYVSFGRLWFRRGPPWEWMMKPTCSGMAQRRPLSTGTKANPTSKQPKERFQVWPWLVVTILGGSLFLSVYERRPIQLEADTSVHQPTCPTPPEEAQDDILKLPKEDAILTTAPSVPPPITRTHPVLLRVPLTTTTKKRQLTSQYKYETWTFNDTVPGPFIRARVGDVVELTITNHDRTGNPHNIDCHAFTGPGGGAAVTTAEENETKTARFKLLYPGLFVYHCAAAPVPVHIANGMYGLIYVQPEDGHLLPRADREYYVMQSEFYHEPPEIEEDGRPSPTVEFSYPAALREEPTAVVFNGSESALTRDRPLKAKTGESARIFFGNAGPNLTSAFHVIGSHFQRVFRDGGVVDPPARLLSTVSVPPGGAAIVDLKMIVPGTYTLVDHAIFRMDKGAVGYLNVGGAPRPDILYSEQPPEPCVGCKLHP
ncbi:putative multicopper oxidase [Aspergillus thermomutatus]|uniref:Copper-containing nitrite reductase n=1 Tax=Aspergillus thermomutatus TaxID=41047 RepID=A0A397G738_ASPTH|nr:uncharacterized protein CDV56_100905 [Aspergillus thermomutatus]RHZ43920.1 hypothetical protein CDV56_100905 [Aspergillus thermomutatus]